MEVNKHTCQISLAVSRSESEELKAEVRFYFTDNAREGHGTLEAKSGLDDRDAGKPHGPREHLHGGVHRE